MTFPGYQPPAALPDELERRRAFSLTGPKAERQRRRMLEGQALGRQVLGALNVELHRVGETVQMVDTLSGELIEGGAGERLPERFAALLHLAAREENHFVGQVLEDEAGPWELGGAAFTPSLRLDPNWMEVYRRRARARARAAVKRAEESLSWKERLQRRMGWRGRYAWAMLTLTMPPVEGATQMLDTKRALRAMELLRKRDEWKDRVRGAIKAVEAKPDAFHPHVHLHVLILARYWEQPAIRTAWGECLERATREVYGVELGEVRPIVDVRAVKRSAKRYGKGNALDMEDALEEVVKYVTKPDDLAELHPNLLVELCSVERWPRMFELLGACREPRKPRPDPSTAQDGPLPADWLDRDAAGGPGSLDTACISDGASPVSIQPSLFEEPPGPAARAPAPVLAQEKPPDPPPKKGRAPTWRELMHVLDLETWLSLMWKRAAACRRFRAKQLFARFPDVVLWTLSGRALQNA